MVIYLPTSTFGKHLSTMSKPAKLPDREEVTQLVKSLDFSIGDTIGYLNVDA
jgi:hypothetical protein